LLASIVIDEVIECFSVTLSLLFCLHQLLFSRLLKAHKQLQGVCMIRLGLFKGRLQLGKELLFELVEFLGSFGHEFRVIGCESF